MTPDELHQLSEEGFIPGPTESEEEFLSRVSYCRKLEENLIKDFSEELGPLDVELENSHSILEESFSLTSPLFGIKPRWVPLFFSNYKLAPWHGGCSWTFKKDETTPWASFLQLRKEFSNRSSLLGLYKRKEVIAHELAHSCRMTFDETLYEEILAYQCQGHFWQKWLGPIVQKPAEAMIFMMVLLLIFFTDLVLITSDQMELFEQLMWMKLVPISLVFLAFFRLYRKRRTFKKAKKRLTELYGNENAQAILFRSTDEEILDYKRVEDIPKFAEIRSESSLRWKQLYLYFRR